MAEAPETLICNAIHRRHRLAFGYDGGTRIVEPYALGVGEGGRLLLRAYQVRGHSPSRDVGWKLFRVDEIEDLTTLDETFTSPQPGYLRNDPTMAKIICEI